MKTGPLLATILLTIVSVAQLLRVVYGWQVTIADTVVPIWISAVACVVAGTVAFLVWKDSRRS